MGEFFASLHTMEWVYLGLFCSGLIYALFLAIFGFGHGHGLDHAGDVDIGHGDVHMDLGHGDVHVDLGHGDVHIDLGHGADLAPDIGDIGDVGHVGDIAHIGDVDHGLHVEGKGHHLLPFNPLVIATFLGGFGGFGILGTQLFGLSPALSLLVATPAGLGLGGGMYFIYSRLLAMSDTSSAVTWQEVRRIPAVVLTPIREKGLGEIVYVVRGSRYSAPARTIDGRAIAKGTNVTILDMEGAVAIVDVRYID